MDLHKWTSLLSDCCASINTVIPRTYFKTSRSWASGIIQRFYSHRSWAVFKVRISFRGLFFVMVRHSESYFAFHLQPWIAYWSMWSQQVCFEKCNSCTTRYSGKEAFVWQLHHLFYNGYVGLCPHKLNQTFLLSIIWLSYFCLIISNIFDVLYVRIVCKIVLHWVNPLVAS